MQLSFLKRASLTRHPLAQQLFKLMDEKQTNLAVALDMVHAQEVLQMADQLGPHVSVIKTHVDILDDYTPAFNEQIRSLANRHKFFVFEDRKFADIGQTVSLQYERGIYRIADWADFVNAHVVPGPGIIEGLKKIGASRGKGLLLLAEMSSFGTLAKGAYTRKAVKLGEQHADYVMGFISLRKVSELPGMIHFTPGVRLHPGKDSLGQRYRTLEEILHKNNSDVAIVGRDITHAANPLQQAMLYRERAWSIYKSKTGQ